MKKLVSVFVITFIYLNGSAQNIDSASVSLYNAGGKTFELFPGTFSWRGTSTYYDMTSWDSRPYMEGQLKENLGANTWRFRQNYRLLFPGSKANTAVDSSGWDPNYKPGYPLIVMMHGGGERGNCWNGSCYCVGACNANGTPVAGTDARFLNNDHNLTHGGLPHLTAVALAGTKKPNDPTLDIRAFPGFVLFPQNLDGWNTADVGFAIRTIRLLCKKYNIDQNRIYIHGLSAGGQAVYKALNMADWLFAAAAPMSAIYFTNSVEYDSIANIPLWAFQGGKDTGPTPAETEGLIRNFREAGGIAKYTLYPNLGHGTWNTAYNEIDFFSWLLSQNKSKIHVYYGDPNICGTTGVGAKLGLAQGFLAYQWERDGQLIPGATSYLYSATIPGVYRARFSRKSNPTESQWNQWSDPVTVSESIPPQAAVTQISTVKANTSGFGDGKVYLNGAAGFANYNWYKNNILFKTDTTKSIIITNSGGCGTANCNNGEWTLVTSGFNKCASPISKPKYVFFANSAPVNITKPPGTGVGAFAGRVISSSSILLTWANITNNERGFEVWRTTTPTGTWQMATLTDEDVVQFLDTNLLPGTKYYYKIRAVSNTGRSDFSPSNTKNSELAKDNLILTTTLDSTPPTPPQNLVATATGIQTITLTWSASTDQSGISQYYIYYSPTDSIATASTNTTYTITSSILSLNTIYNFTVKAVDFANNYSSKSNQATANTYVYGLFYEHSTGVWLNTSAVPDIRVISSPTNYWANPEFKGVVPNFTLAGTPPIGPRTQDDFFNFRFDGYLYISVAGNYKFQITSNDAMQFYIDNLTTAKISDNLGSATVDASVITTSGNVNLTVGAHLIRLNFMEYTGNQELVVSYSKTSNPGAFGYTPIPDPVLRSGNYVAPTPPIAPINLTATGVSMTQIDLAWQFTGTPPAEYEVYRSSTSGGTYTMVKHATSTAYSDINLLPGTTYYYKIKTVNANGASPFTSVVNATTLTDAIAPTQPTGVTVITSTFTNASLVWNVSTDNVLVTGYEIYANNILIGTSAIPGYLATNLTPNTFYSFTVKAYDASGNKSIISAAATATTSNAVIYYSKSSGNLNQTTSWGLNADGSGTAPDFTFNGAYYTISNRTTSSLGGNWNVDGSISKVIVPNGVTLTVDNLFAARVEVTGTGAVNLNHVTVPQLISLSPTSTITYNTATFVAQNTYGNLALNGTGYKTFPSGTTAVLGNLNTSAGVALKGAGGNNSKISLNGDLTVAGTPGVTPPDFGVLLEFTNSGTQNVSAGGNLDLYKIATLNASSIINVQNSGTAFSLNLGSLVGGGLSLVNGSTLNLNNNSLVLSRAATINPANESGKISINKGDITITSTSSSNSNLYFDAVYDSINYLGVDLTGSGDVIMRSQAAVKDAIKIKNGELNAGGFLKLISNSTKTANIQEIENTGVITGNVTVQRYLNPKGRVYRYISSPVAGIKVSDWQAFFPITGVFVGASTGSGLSTAASFFYYDEPTAWIAYPATATGTDNTAPIEKGRGYAAFIRNATTPTVLQATGNPYQGTFAFANLDAGTGLTTDGWNLLGNPYASTIAWSDNTAAWLKSTSIGSTVSVRENATTPTAIGQFKYYDAITKTGTLTGGKIAPGQAFWVQATGSSASLTITEKAKSTEQQVIYREGDAATVSHMRVALKQGTLEDPGFIAFTENGKDIFQPELDGVKQKNIGMFSLSLLADAVSVAINNVSDSFCTKIVSLNLENVNPGQYSLMFDEMENLVGIQDIVLTDNFTNQTIPVGNASSYTFTVSANTRSFGSSRFSLSFGRPQIDTNISLSSNNICGDGSAQIVLLNTQAGAEYQAQNASGENISQIVTGNGSSITLLVPTSYLTTGTNTIKINAGFKGCTTTTLATNTEVVFTQAPIVSTEQEFISVCPGGQATLTVSGAPGGGSYKWFENQTEITWNTGSTLETHDIRSLIYYAVSAVHANGCVGPKKIIGVAPEEIEVPIIDFANDTLYAISSAVIHWKKDGQEIEGETSFSYKPVSPGIYTATATSGSCTLESLPFEYVITDVENPGGFDYLVSVYPNPTSASSIKIKVTTKDVLPVEISILNIVGEAVYQAQYEAQSANEGLVISRKNSLPDGLYIVLVRQGDTLTKKKLLIKN